MRKFKSLYSLFINFIIVFTISSCSKNFSTSELSRIDKELVSNTNISQMFINNQVQHGLLGFGYDVTKEYANANSAGFKIIDIDRINAEHPYRIMIDSPRTSDYLEEYGATAKLFSNMITSKVNLEVNFPLFKKTLNSVFSSSDTSSSSFNGKYIYGSYNLTIKQKRFRVNYINTDFLKSYLLSTFITDINNKSVEQIVKDYGTHVMLDIYVGAKLDILFQSETANQDRMEAARVGIKSGVKDVFNLDIINSVNLATSEKNFNRKLAYRTRGGDPSKSLVGELSFDESTPSKVNISNWANSSNSSNAVLVDFGEHSLLPLYELINDESKKNALRNYIHSYMLGNSVSIYHSPVPIYNIYSFGYGMTTYSISSELPSPANYYTNMGASFYAFSYNAPGTVPIYKYYLNNSPIRDRVYKQLTSNYWSTGYVNNGIAFYAYPSSTSLSKPVYHYTLSGRRSFNYLSTFPSESQGINRGIAFYVPQNSNPIHE